LPKFSSSLPQLAGQPARGGARRGLFFFQDRASRARVSARDPADPAELPLRVHAPPITLIRHQVPACVRRAYEATYPPRETKPEGNQARSPPAARAGGFIPGPAAWRALRRLFAHAFPRLPMVSRAWSPAWSPLLVYSSAGESQALPPRRGPLPRARPLSRADRARAASPRTLREGPVPPPRRPRAAWSGADSSTG
jgi:hypothetical protein